jgi:hypothetical protein
MLVSCLMFGGWFKPSCAAMMKRSSLWRKCRDALMSIAKRYSGISVVRISRSM